MGEGAEPVVECEASPELRATGQGTEPGGEREGSPELGAMGEESEASEAERRRGLSRSGLGFLY